MLLWIHQIAQIPTHNFRAFIDDSQLDWYFDSGVQMQLHCSHWKTGMWPALGGQLPSMMVWFTMLLMLEHNSIASRLLDIVHLLGFGNMSLPPQLIYISLYVLFLYIV